MLKNEMRYLEVTTNDGVQVIKLNRPEKKNAINPKMYKQITEILNDSATDSSVILTVLTGNGNYYSSGNDFSPESVDTFSDTEQKITEVIALLQKFVAAFIDYPKLLIAVVNGPAIGIATTTLALCDIVYASDKAWFMTPFTRIGLTPEGCSSITFPRMMGTAKANKLLYLSEKLPVNEALACGFVTQVFPDSELVSKTSTLIQEIAKIPAEGLRMSKQLVRRWDRDLLHRVNQEESRIIKERFGSEEFFNAMLTFNKKKSKL